MLRRKEKSESVTLPKKHTSNIDDEDPEMTCSNIFFGVLVTTITIAFFAISISFLATNTLTFGFKVPSFKKLYPRSMRVFTVTELSEFNGIDVSKPTYISLGGQVFDVSDGDAYKPGGSYHFFSGRDASRAFVTGLLCYYCIIEGCFQSDLTHDMRGLTENDIKDLNDWIKFYATHHNYFKVGTVDLPEIDPYSPIPVKC